MIRNFLTQLETIVNPVIGLDAYSGNHNWMDFPKFVKDGYKFIIFKAGQGGLANVPRLYPNWRREAEDAGLLVGWYWLFDARYSPGYHMRAVRKYLDPLDMPALGIYIDIERPYLSLKWLDYWQMPYAGYKLIGGFMSLLEGDGYGHRSFNEMVGLYTNPNSYNHILSSAPTASLEAFAKRRLWTANYPYVYVPGVTQPTMYGLWETWLFHQYQERPDENAFNGTYEQFQQLFGDATPPPPPPPEPPKYEDDGDDTFEDGLAVGRLL